MHPTGDNSDSDRLTSCLRDARERTLALIADLSDDQLLGPRLSILNPLLWEIGHVAWFQEKWLLRRQGQPSLHDLADVLYDSAAIAHDTRWDLHLPSRHATLGYMSGVLDRVLKSLENGVDDENAYFARLALFHEDMHDEAFTYTRQTLGYPVPSLTGTPLTLDHQGPYPGDAGVEGGSFKLGAFPANSFVFDNEKWAHDVAIKSFSIAKTPVTQEQFSEFVNDGGYSRKDLWSAEGHAWLSKVQANQPLYWRFHSRQWERRRFDRWVKMEPNRPMIHVNWFEADAYCRWARRRLPTEAEWEYAAAGPQKQKFPWGEDEPSAQRANLDWQFGDCVDVSAFPLGDSWCGCRQMIGNIWEWTADDFLPYPGFSADPYKEYSEPWFGNHKVLRGGCWASRSRLIRNTWRNFYTPDRRDVWSGFRTCAL